MAIQSRLGKDGIRRYRARRQRAGHRHVGPWRDSKFEAARDEADMLAAIAAGTWSREFGPDRVPTFREAAEHHLAEFEKLVTEGKRSKRTLQDKRWQLAKHILAELGDRRIDLVTHLDIQRLKRRLYRDVSGPTVNRYLANVSSVFRSARAWCVNPVSGVERYEENADRWTATTPEEAEELIGAAGADSNPNARMLLLVIWEGALRSRSEALTLRWDEVDWAWRDGRGIKRGLILLPSTKAGEAQAVPMSKRLRRELAAWRKCTPGEWVFPGRREGKGTLSESAMYAAWKRVKKAAGFSPTLRLHDFRHGRATDLIRMGAPRAKVQRFLRHKTRLVTDRYVHMTELDAADALEYGEKIEKWSTTRSSGKSRTAGKDR